MIEKINTNVRKVLLALCFIMSSKLNEKFGHNFIGKDLFDEINFGFPSYEIVNVVN